MINAFGFLRKCVPFLIAGVIIFLVGWGVWALYESDQKYYEQQRQEFRNTCVNHLDGEHFILNNKLVCQLPNGSLVNMEY